MRNTLVKRKPYLWSFHEHRRRWGVTNNVANGQMIDVNIAVGPLAFHGAFTAILISAYNNFSAPTESG